MEKFYRTETYQQLTSVWGQIQKQLGEEGFEKLKAELKKSVSRQLKHEVFVEEHFNHVVEELSIGKEIYLQGNRNLDAVVINIYSDSFEVQIVESDDKEIVGKKMMINKKIMNEVFDNCVY